MRLCIGLGFHRRASLNNSTFLVAEMRKRIFWACYCMDRQLSITLGRPFAISDHDIDIDVGLPGLTILLEFITEILQLPLDVDEAAEVAEAAAASPGHPRPSDKDGAPSTSTSMSCFIHITRLRIIESNIQQHVYRVDQSTKISEKEVDHYLHQLQLWKSKIPLDTSKMVDQEASAFDGYDYYVRFLS